MLNMGQMPGGCAGSSFTHCISSLFANVLIVVDGRAVEGRQIGPIADYIAVLALSQASALDDCSALPSILDLQSSKCGDRPKPDSWTDDDAAYLKGLYRANLETVLWVEKDSIADQMVRGSPSASDAGKK